MSKCPCEECISYAMCINSKSVTLILEGYECELILDYMKDWSTVLNTIKILKPCWYRKNPNNLHVEAEHLLGRVTRMKTEMTRKY